MANNRDDFSPRTKTDLALRASYLCSFCGASTVGPSDESSNAVTMVGKAAHICAASPGGRRFDPTMTKEQRVHINNGIWLCAMCADLVDRDEVRFTVQILHQIRREHEESRRLGPASNSNIGDIVGFGDELIATGSIISSGPSGIRIRLEHFVEGSSRDLLSFIRDFYQHPPEKRFVLMNELGFGGILEDVPTVERVGSAFEVQFRLAPGTPRRDANAGTDMCAETGKMLTGLPVYVQNFERTLGTARGTWFAALESGSNLSDLYWRYRGSPWFARLAMIEMIRLASIPSSRPTAGERLTPFACVNRVDRVEVPTFDLEGQHLALNVTFDLQGVGQWSGTLKVFISTPEQLIESRAKAHEHNANISRLEELHQG